MELAAERKALDSEWINAEDLRRTLAEFDGIWSSLTTKEQEQLIHLLVAKVGYDGRTTSRDTRDNPINIGRRASRLDVPTSTHSGQNSYSRSSLIAKCRNKTQVHLNLTWFGI